MIFLMACAASTESGAAPEAVLPNEGDWAITMAQTWEGDCVLEDMATHQPEFSTWVVELEPVGFTLYDETGYPSGCSLEATGAFACPDGVYDVSYVEGGYDAVEYIRSTVEGVFEDATTMQAALMISADCEGVDCAEVGLIYGDAFEYGCTAEAPFSGIWGAS